MRRVGWRGSVLEGGGKAGKKDRDVVVLELAFIGQLWCAGQHAVQHLKHTYVALRERSEENNMSIDALLVNERDENKLHARMQ